jgi:hypothetical protein
MVLVVYLNPLLDKEMYIYTMMNYNIEIKRLILFETKKKKKKKKKKKG